jgi:G3E family GTPase
MNRRLPVTLVGGFLGAGKTSFLHHLISEYQGGNLAVFVEDPGPLNLDAKAIRGLCGAMGRKHDKVFEIPATDVTAQIDWIANQLRECCGEGRFERVLIEVGGLTSATLLGQNFGILPDQSEKFARWAELHQIICVVDILDFFRAILNPAQSNSPDSLPNLQRTQIENASLLILNKCDLVEDAERQTCMRSLRAINPHAPIIETAYGEILVQIWSRPGTLQELGLALEPRVQPKIESKPETGQPDLASTLYRAYRPFHPERFWEWFNAAHPGLLRMKGLIWLATRNLIVGGVSRTRWQNACGGAGIWWAALPREEWPEETEALARMQETWREPYGDRRQELVLVGYAAELADIINQLNACLLNAEEYARPVTEWTAWPDPFPAWDLEDKI